MDPPYDVIVVLGGGELTKGRVKEAVRLYRQGVAKYFVFVGGRDEVSFVKEMVGTEANGVFIDGNSSSTADNAYYAKKIVEKLGAKRILIVTSEFHVKRAIKTFELFFGDDYKIDAVGVEDRPDPYTLTKERFLDDFLYLYDYLKGLSDKELKAFFDLIKGPLNKALRKAADAGIL